MKGLLRSVSLVIILFFGKVDYGFGQIAVFMAAGQSNAVGKGDSSISVDVHEGVAFEYKYQMDQLVPLKDPVGENLLNFQQAGTGSLWPSFANAYFELSNMSVVIIPAAMGGSSCNHKAETSSTWDSVGKRLLLANAIKKGKATESLLKQRIDGIVWLQGERDANAIFEKKLTESEFHSSLISVIQRFRTGLGYAVPFYIVLTGNQRGREPIGNRAVRKVQLAVAREIPGVYIVYRKAESFDKSKMMKDHVHYNQVALNRMGVDIAKSIVRLQKK